MFPRYKDWDIAYTPSGLVKQKIRQVLSYAVLATIVACVAIAEVSGIGLVGLAKGSLSRLLDFLEYRIIYCRQLLDHCF